MTLQASIAYKRPNGFEVNVDIVAERSRITALFGASGSGKTTILRLIAGLLRIPEGIKISNDEVTWADQHTFLPVHLRGVGYVSQTNTLFPHLNVLGNLTFAQKHQHQDSGIELDQVCNWLGVEALLERQIHELSGGQKQRVAIARVLLNGPRIILMDEPLASLDPAAKRQILPYLEQLHDRLDVPFIYVSHALDEITYLADDLYQLEQGRIVVHGSVFELGSSLDLNATVGDEAAAILQCNIQRHEHSFNLTHMDFEGETLLVNGLFGEAGEKVRVRIPARDVSLTLSRPTDSSVLNIIPSIVGATRELFDKSLLIELKVGKQTLLSRITAKSYQHLCLTTGQSVFAQVKGVALLSDHAR